MQDILAKSLSRLKQLKARRMRLIAILLVLSFVVSLDVFWILRQPGLTLAGDADCKITEHTHDESCQNSESPCTLTEHIHTIECYSDETADAETQLDWQNMFANYPYTGNLQEDLPGIAKTQVGYTESTKNFQVDDGGVRRGYTRYGAWYGMPYSDWSAMFVSFCLHYAGADPDEFPGNTGAASMATLWKKLNKYAPAGAHQPAPGDLAFFADNTVGIVVDVQTATICVVRGDVNNAVSNDVFRTADETIVGWGLTSGTPPEAPSDPLPQQQETPAPSTPSISKEELLDISNGPAFFIFENGDAQPRAQTFSLRATRTTATDLLAYLQAKKGTYFFTLLDRNNHELPRDSEGNYLAQPDTGYKLTISFNSPDGFLPGTYEYQVPNGLLVDGGKGDFILSDNTHVGSWVVTDDGLVTLTFNSNMNDHTEITISATLGIRFIEQADPYDFDGKITVIVEKPPEDVQATQIEKWAVQGDPALEKNDPTKIYWTIRITGNRDSHILGSQLMDETLDHEWSYPHRYTESDIAAGINFGASVLNPETGKEEFWHQWHVDATDPNITWDEHGWSYEMPESITCLNCGNLVVLGNENWVYYADYTTTPDPTNVAGGLYYANKAEIDNQQTEGWFRFTQTEVDVDIIKHGAFVSDATGGKFVWEVLVTIPGRKEGETTNTNWIVFDEMDVIDKDYNIIGRVVTDIHHATVTANYHGKTITVPRIQDATEDDPYVWMAPDWAAGNGGSTRHVYLLGRCHCTEENCAYEACWTWGYDTDDGGWINSSGYCPCWTETEDTTFTFTYYTDDAATLEAYDGLHNQVRNRVTLKNDISPDIARNYAAVPIPDVIQKELTHDFDGYTANYKITVNESKMVLTDGSPMVIHDVMTDTLAFISGSLVIHTEDANGNVAQLQQDVDYTITYDGSGTQLDENGKKVHILDITILNPQPVMYTLDYDATLIMPDKVTEGLKYKNSATVSLWGKTISDSSTEKVYGEFNISANRYRVDLIKTSTETGLPLAGATFGLFNEHGGLIASGTTDENGFLSFKTDVENGIILREHVLYYLQELRAPPGYRQDNSKHWICFCNETGDTCSTYNPATTGKNAIRIPYGQTGNISIANAVLDYDLPATGGSGISPVIPVSVVFIITPLVYMSIRRRKRERRGVG